MKPHLMIAIAALLLCACVAVAPAGVRVQDGILTSSTGMTLYTFDKDAVGSGKSGCNGPCATNWPPLAASAMDASSGDWMVVTRDDGTRQWAYKGRPVYLWVKDTKPGDRTGDRVNNAWTIARP